MEYASSGAVKLRFEKTPMFIALMLKHRRQLTAQHFLRKKAKHLLGAAVLVSSMRPRLLPAFLNP